MQEREGALDDPPMDTQAGAVLHVAAGDHRSDAEFAHQAPVRRRRYAKTELRPRPQQEPTLNGVNSSNATRPEN